MAVLNSPKALTGSAGARRTCALLLEAFAGLRSTVEVAEALGVTQPRYYQLEARGLQGMIDALEPRKRGRQKSTQDALVASEQERQRMQRELMRYQALYRTSQRCLGVKKAEPKSTKRTRRVRKKARGHRVISVLREGAEEAEISTMPLNPEGEASHANGSTEQGNPPRG